MAPVPDSPALLGAHADARPNGALAGAAACEPRGASYGTAREHARGVRRLRPLDVVMILADGALVAFCAAVMVAGLTDLITVW